MFVSKRTSPFITQILPSSANHLMTTSSNQMNSRVPTMRTNVDIHPQKSSILCEKIKLTMLIRKKDATSLYIFFKFTCLPPEEILPSHQKWRLGQLPCQYLVVQSNTTPNTSPVTFQVTHFQTFQIHNQIYESRN